MAAVLVILSAGIVIALVLSLLIDVPAAHVLPVAAVFCAIASGGAAFWALNGLTPGRARMRRVRSVPVAGSLTGDDFIDVIAASSVATRRWCAGCVLAAIGVIAAAGPQHFIPRGQADVRNGRYVETVHGAVTRYLTHEQFVRDQMTTLRLFLSASLLFVLVAAVVVSGARRAAAANPSS